MYKALLDLILLFLNMDTFRILREKEKLDSHITPVLLSSCSVLITLTRQFLEASSSCPPQDLCTCCSQYLENFVFSLSLLLANFYSFFQCQKKCNLFLSVSWSFTALPFLHSLGHSLQLEICVYGYLFKFCLLH